MRTPAGAFWTDGRLGRRDHLWRQRGAARRGRSGAWACSACPSRLKGEKRHDGAVLLFVGSALVNNFLLTRFLGICPFLGVTRELKAGVGMGIAVTSVMVASVLVIWADLPLGPCAPGARDTCRTSSSSWSSPPWSRCWRWSSSRFLPRSVHRAFGIDLPLDHDQAPPSSGLALPDGRQNYTFLQSLVFAMGSGAGITPGDGDDGGDP